MSVRATNRRVEKATGLPDSHAEILHDARVRHHVRHLDMVGKDAGVVAKALAKIVRHKARSLWSRSGSHKAASPTTSALRGHNTTRIGGISILTHSAICSDNGQHGFNQSSSFASSCSETPNESCQLNFPLFFRLLLMKRFFLSFFRYDLKFAKAVQALRWKTVHW